MDARIRSAILAGCQHVPQGLGYVYRPDEAAREALRALQSKAGGQPLLQRVEAAGATIVVVVDFAEGGSMLPRGLDLAVRDALGRVWVEFERATPKNAPAMVSWAAISGYLPLVIGTPAQVGELIQHEPLVIESHYETDADADVEDRRRWMHGARMMIMDRVVRAVDVELVTERL
jgi:hypothetical protein